MSTRNYLKKHGRLDLENKPEQRRAFIQEKGKDIEAKFVRLQQGQRKAKPSG